MRTKDSHDGKDELKLILRILEKIATYLKERTKVKQDEYRIKKKGLKN